MFKYTKYLLKKIEDLFGDLHFTIRYEKGNFQSGYCIVEDRDIIVINKFYDTEARINCLLEILDGREIPEDQLSEESQKTWKKLQEVLSSTKIEES